LKKNGAGFLIGKIFPDGNIRFLGLVAPIETRVKKKGIFDIPKGKIKPGESSLDCAIRECFEESGILISRKDIIGKPYSDKNLIIYPAISNSDVEILPNPETGIVEHEGAMWLSRDEIENLCLDYLSRIIKKLTVSFTTRVR